MTKKAIITVLLLTFGVTAFAQKKDYKKAIKTEFEKYLGYIESKNFEKSTDYLVPELFETFPKENMITVLNEQFNNKELVINIKNAKVTEVEAPEKIAEKYYAKVTYSNDLFIKLPEREMEADSKRTLRIRSVLTSFQMKYGTENVAFNSETNFFEIKATHEVYAISDNEITWKFLPMDTTNSAHLYKKLLPAKLVPAKEEAPATE